MELRVIRKSERCVVVDKPSGLLSVPGKGPDKADCVPARVLALFPDATGPMIVHRLDMDTSGLMVVALDAAAQRDLSLQFERRKTLKRYLALLHGHAPMRESSTGIDHMELHPEDATDWPVIDCSIRLDPQNRPFQVHDPVHGRPSRTRYRLDGHAWFHHRGHPRPVTRVVFEPITGRSHQLRVHAALTREIGGLGLPIVGDPLYGIDKDRNETTRPRLMLHACTLGLTEPGTDRWVICHSSCPWESEVSKSPEPVPDS